MPEQDELKRDKDGFILPPSMQRRPVEPAELKRDKDGFILPPSQQRIPSSLDVNESVRRHHSPQPELLGLTPAEMNQPVGSSREPRQRATIGPAPTFLGSHNLYYAKKRAGEILWGKDDPFKLPHEQSTFDRLGVMGGPVSELTGIPMTKGQREEYSRMGGGLAGGIKGSQYGMRSGNWRKGLIGGVLGGSLGGTTAQAVTSGTLPTPGQQLQEGVYGVVPSAIRPGIGAVKGAVQMGGRLAAINETALQTQSLIDKGEPADLSPAAVIERNLLAAGLGGVLGAVAGRKWTREAVENDVDLSPALHALRQRVTHWESRVQNAKHAPKGSTHPKHLEKRNAKFQDKLKEAQKDLDDFINDPEFMLKRPGSRQSVRISQVIREGVEGNAGYDANEALAKTYLRFGQLEDAPKSYKRQAQEHFDAVKYHLSSRFHPLKALERDVRASRGMGKPVHDLGAKFEMLPGSYSKAELDLLKFDESVTKRLHDMAKEGTWGQRLVAQLYKERLNSVAKEGTWGKSKDSMAEVRKDFDVYMFLNRTKQRLQRVDALKAEQAQVQDEINKLTKVKENQRTPEEVAYLKELTEHQARLNETPDKSVAGYTIQSVDEQLMALRSKLGEENHAEFGKISNVFQEQADIALRLQVESGRMPKDRYDAIKAENDFYAPFRVQGASKRIDDAALKGSVIDTQKEYTQAIKGITDKDFMLHGIVEQMRNMVFTSRTLSEKNLRMQDFAKMADLDIDGRFVRQVPAERTRAKEGHSFVTVLKDGEAVRYEVANDVAEPIKNFGEVSKGLGTVALRASAMPFKMGATGLNIAFQGKNLFLADLPRAALISHYGIKNPVDVARFTGDYVHSLYSAITGNFSTANQLYREAMEAGVLRSGLQQMISPEALMNYKKLDAGPGVVDTLSKFGNVIEESFKVLGTKRAIRLHGAKNVQELLERNPEAITEIRRMMGSPDFSRFGKSMETANLWFMFMNARTQGVISDASRLGSVHTKKGRSALTRMGIAVGGPTAALWAYNRANHAEDMKLVPQRDKDNNHIIFTGSYITDEHGNVLPDYHKIPKREAAKMYANTLEAGLEFMAERNPEALGAWATQMVENLSPINIEGDTAGERLESIGSGLHPVPRMFAELGFAGREGRSLWQHRDLMSPSMADAKPQNQYTDRTPKEAIRLAHWIHKKSGGKAPDVLRSPIKLNHLIQGTTAGLLSQFMPDEPKRGRSEFRNHWIVRSLGSSFMSGGYKYDDERAKLIRQLRQEAANDTVVGMRDSRKFVDERGGKTPNRIMREFIDLHPLRNDDRTPNWDNQRQLQRVADRIAEIQRGIKIEDRVIRSLPNKQRAKFITEQLDGVSDSMQLDYIRTYMKKGLLTEDVAKYMIDDLREIFQRNK